MESKTVFLSGATLSAIRADVSKDIQRQRSGMKVVDGFIADGVTPEMLVAPKKGQDRAFYDQLCEAIVAGFSASAVAMLDGDVKALPEIGKAKAALNRDAKCKENRKYWQQQIGSKVKDYRNSLTKRLGLTAKAEAEEAGEEVEEDAKASWESNKRKALSDMIAQAQKIGRAHV